MATNTFLERGRRLHRPLAVIYADTQAAFYSVMPQVVLGALLTMPSCAAAFLAVGMTAAEACSFAGVYSEGASGFSELGFGGPWGQAVADWRSRILFRVPRGSRKIATWVGCRPGDPLADDVFNIMAFAVLQQLLIAEHTKLGLDIMVDHRGKTIFPGEAAPHTTAILPPAFMDDLVFLVESDSRGEPFAHPALGRRRGGLHCAGRAWGRIRTHL